MRNRLIGFGLDTAFQFPSPTIEDVGRSVPVPKFLQSEAVAANDNGRVLQCASHKWNTA
jgi:hypothetical protein